MPNPIPACGHLAPARAGDDITGMRRKRTRRMVHRNHWFSFALTGCLWLAACDSPSKPVAVASVAITAPAARLVEGTSQQLTATVLDARGNVLTGRVITWSVEKSNVAAVSATGLVTAIAPGTTSVTATSEGKLGTLSLTVSPVPVASIRLAPPTSTLIAGATQQFVAELRDANGNSLTDRSLAWSSSDASVATVSASGLAFGVAAGAASIAVATEGVNGIAAITVLAPNAPPSIQSIVPSLLTPGATATITGLAFGSPDSLSVTIGGVPAPIVGGAPGQLVVLVPCVRRGAVDVRVIAGARSGSRPHAIDTRQHTLGVGQSLITTETTASTCNELAASGGSARYLVAVFSSGTSPATLTDFVLEGNPAAGGAAPRVAPLARPLTERPAMRDTETVSDSVHYRVLERERARYVQLRGTASRPPTPTARVVAPLPELGEMRSAYFTFTGGCSDTTRVMRSRAIFVGARSIIWEDSANTLLSSAVPALADYYRRLGVMFDQDQYEVVRRNFGDPLLRDAETDGDGRVHMIFSQRLNGTGAAAYVTSCDQFPRTSARGSNLGEIFYGSVPTVSGSNPSSTASPDGWFYFMGRTVVHEVKHIASMAARVAIGAASFEQSWLEEGTARHAEELWIRGALHKVAWKANTGFGTAATNGIYCDFHPVDATCNAADALRRPGYGMRRHFNEIREKLLEPWNWSPYGTAADQTGSIFYQTTWSLVRYTIDRYAVSDAAFFQALTNTSATGTANLTAVAGVPLDRLIGGWGLSLYADDFPGLVNPDPDVRFPTWNLRDIYSGLNQAPSWSTRWNTPFPIRPTALPFGAFATARTGLRGGAHAYYELPGQSSASQLLSLRSLGGGAPSSLLRIAVVRLQ